MASSFVRASSITLTGAVRRVRSTRLIEAEEVMVRGKRVATVAVLATALLCLLPAQRPFREYPSVEYGGRFPLPTDWQKSGEWTFARLMYPPGPLDGYSGRFDGPWQEGLSLWTQDYPRADRALANAVKRLTRADARSVEQSVSLDDGDEIYNWPWLYAVQGGAWGLRQREADKLRA